MSYELLDYHRGLLTDAARMSGWKAAVCEAVRPGQVVLDLGAGTGILSLLACAAEAGRVYAIEQSAIIEVAREAARAAGFGDRIRFFHQSSWEVQLPERVDVVLGEVFGHFGLNDSLAAALADARERFLKPGGVLVPESVEMWAVPVEAADWRQKVIESWGEDLGGFNYLGSRKRALNTLNRIRFGAAAALAEPVCLGRVSPLEASRSTWSGRAQFRISRDGELGGLGGWCVGRLTRNVSITNSPFAAAPLAWPQAMLAVEKPVAVTAGDTVEAEVQSGPYGPWTIWNWQVEVKAGEASRARFRHSTFQGQLISLEQIRKQSESFTPQAGPYAEAVKAVLELCDGSRTLAAIREEMARRFPGLFVDAAQAARFVARIVGSLCG